MVESDEHRHGRKQEDIERVRSYVKQRHGEQDSGKDQECRADEQSYPEAAESEIRIIEGHGRFLCGGGDEGI